MEGRFKLDKYKKLVNNSIVFTIGSFGSKVINFIMVPLYTNKLMTAEYGTVDLLINTINLILPFLTFELGQAALRFAVEYKNKKRRQNIFNLLITHGTIASIVVIIFSLIAYKVMLIQNYLIYTAVLLILNIFNNLFSNFIRGIGRVKEFAFNGILMTLTTVISNIFLLVIFDLKIYGYLISLVLTFIISNIYLIYVILGDLKLELFFFDKNLYNELLGFSLPTVPNSTIWWIINGSTRYFILFLINSNANGLYAVANKIPSILSIITSIFSQAWQLSSFEEYNSEDRDNFFSEVLHYYIVILFTGSSFIIVFLKLIMKYFVDISYFESWKIVPFLLMAVSYQSFSSFLGTNYTASKQTSGTFFTSIFGGVISIISSLIFIPMFGVIGAGVSSLLSFIGMFLIRLYDTRKFVSMKIDWKRFAIYNFLIGLQIFCIFVFENKQNFIFQLIIFCILLVVSFNSIYKIVKKVLFNKRKQKSN